MIKHSLYNTIQSVDVSPETTMNGMLITACDLTVVFVRGKEEDSLKYFAKKDETVTCDDCVLSLLGDLP